MLPEKVAVEGGDMFGSALGDGASPPLVPLPRSLLRKYCAMAGHQMSCVCVCVRMFVRLSLGAKIPSRARTLCL